MRFRRLLVSAYRAIERASLELGPSLNVLYGPNDLGKTTLAAALRSALLLPADSSAHQAFVSWQAREPPQVTLEFEHGGTLFRVGKTFGSGSRAQAVLERSSDGEHFAEEARGRAVDRRLRELLSWGIEAPGGKGGTRGLPESFLSHVLLGTQHSVAKILERSLSDDRDGSGRERLHEALQALAQDPSFKRVLEAAQAKVDSAFTPLGRWRTGQNTPFSSVREQINLLAEQVERYARQRRESEDVLSRMEQASRERSEAEARRLELERRLSHEREARLVLSRAQALEERCRAARRTLEEHAAAERGVRELEEEIGDALVRERAAAGELEGAQALVQSRQRELQSAEAELLRQAAADHQRSDARAADLRTELAAAERELACGREELELERRVRETETAAARERSTLEACATGEQVASEKVGTAERALLALQRLEHVGHLVEAERALERAQAARADEVELMARAEALRRSLAAEQTPELLARLTPGVLSALRKLEEEMRLAEARLSVGLSLALTLRPLDRVTLSVDAGAPQNFQAERGRREVRAARSIEARLPHGIELSVRAGDPELQARFEGLRERFQRETEEPFRAAQVSSFTELCAWVERAQAELARREARAREVSALEERAAEKRAQAASLEPSRRRADERRKQLGAAASADLEQDRTALTALGEGWESTLLERRRAAEQALVRARAELDAQARERVRLATRVLALEEAVTGARAERASFRERAEPSGAALGEAELAARLEAGEARLKAARSALEQFEQHRRSSAERLVEARARAVEATESASACYAALKGAHEAAREQRVTLESRCAERRQRLEGFDVGAARADLDKTVAELDALGPLPEVSAEALAATEAELGQATALVAQINAELSRAEGALGHVGGDVAAIKERQALEALARSRELEVDLERDYEAYRLLSETLREVEQEQGVHLGRTLEGPVSARFERLTRGRYARVTLDPALSLSGVLVAGQPRAYGELSEGTQEQLATILRLCVAEQLGTALVLDDHLAQSHDQRIAWFRGALREAAARIQIIVLTARPEDYLEPGELGGEAEAARGASAALRVLNLERIIQRYH